MMVVAREGGILVSAQCELEQSTVPVEIMNFTVVQAGQLVV